MALYKFRIIIIIRLSFYIKEYTDQRSICILLSKFCTQNQMVLRSETGRGYYTDAANESV